MAEKIFYTIGEVAEMFDLSVSKVRYWDSCFNILKLERTKKGNRLFRPEDVKHFRSIYHLIEEKGMTIKGAQEYLKHHKLSDIERDAVVIEKLEGIKSLLREVALNMKEREKGGTILYDDSEF